MDPVVIVHSPDNQPQSTEPPSVPHQAPPTLRPTERYHVFMSYSSTDSHWAHAIIHRLESHGLQVCFHERDFTPGRTVLDNMSECIQESQKVLLVLSPEFVRSRWCLLEANMSLFRDCLERKPIVPVLLDPNVAVPLHLCHLTYLEASDPHFFGKLLKVLCTPNGQLQGSTVVPFQPPSLYNGKALQPLAAVNSESLEKWECGYFNDMNVPDQLRLIITDEEKYRRAIRKINHVIEKNAWLYSRTFKVLLECVMLLLVVLILGTIGPVIFFRLGNYFWSNVPLGLSIVCLVSFSFTIVAVLAQEELWKERGAEDSVKALQRAAGQANIILIEEKVLLGSMSNSELYLVYVSLDGCRREFAETFSGHTNVEDIFHRALVYFSSGYACCLAKKHFPFSAPSDGSHLEGGVCFCQYVSKQLSAEKWE